MKYNNLISYCLSRLETADLSTATIYIPFTQETCQKQTNHQSITVSKLQQFVVVVSKQDLNSLSCSW